LIVIKSNFTAKYIFMTAQEIQKIIDNDRLAINNAPFPEKLPDWLLDNFDEIIMGERQNVNPYTAQLLRSVLSKRDDPSKLTVYEGGWVLNVLNAVQPFLIAKDKDEFLEKKEFFGAVMFRFNLKMAEEERKLEIKERKLKEGNRKMILT